MSQRRLILVTATMMISLFLASLESTVVATAMPTIVAQLGGLSIYAWVFSAYMVASTTTMPIYGKLSDTFGRGPVYFVVLGVFLIGSLLCGLAQNMPQLVIFRAVQGLGAGGLLPLVFIVVGDIFSFEQRARVQGLFSGVWGVSSVIGPLLGGFLVDHANWRWVFLLNLPVGLLAAGIMLWSWRETAPRRASRVDWAGAALLTAGVVVLLLALLQLNDGGWRRPDFWALLALAALLLVGLWRVERRTPDPLLPLPLFRDRLFATASGHGFLAGFAVFGGIAFIPFFVQSVLGSSATLAGASLTPLALAWAVASIVGGRLLLRFGHRSISLAGMTALVAGIVPMTRVGPHESLAAIMLYGSLIGTGMGLSVPAFLIAVQSGVPRQSLGTATSTLQFSRNIGGAIGVSVMGVILALRLAAGLEAAGLDPSAASLAGLLDPLARGDAAASLLPLRDSLAAAVRTVFVVALVASAAGWGVTALTPRGRIGASAAVQASPESAATVE